MISLYQHIVQPMYVTHFELLFLTFANHYHNVEQFKSSDVWKKCPEHEVFNKVYERTQEESTGGLH